VDSASVRHRRGPDGSGGDAASRRTRRRSRGRGVDPATIGETVGEAPAWTRQ
jgi:hypothetical protein